MSDGDARTRVATLLRELGHEFVARELSDEALSRLAGEIEVILAEITSSPGRVRQRSISSFESFRESIPQHGKDEPRQLFADSIVSGAENPMGLGAYLWRDGDQAVMEVTLGKAFEGAPERAHGGIVAALLDETMGMVLSIHGTIGLTARLSISYLAATPVLVPLVTRAWLERREGRKVEVRATVEAGGQVVVEAEALFISVDLSGFSARSSG